METMTESTMTATVSKIARGLGYEVLIEPSIQLRRGIRSGGIKSFTHAHMLSPDLLVRHNGRSVIIEIKGRGILFGGVMQTLQYAEAFDAAGVLCVPDGAFADTPLSVLQYAEAENVLICPMSDIGDALAGLLGQADEAGSSSSNF